MAQVLWLLLGPVLPAGSTSTSSATFATELVLGLAVAAAALLVVVAAAGIRLPTVRAFRTATRLRTRAVVRPPRLSDPDAAGRPRPRAPSVCPAATA